LKQYLLRAPGELELVERPPLVPGPGEIVLSVRAALTCGTDLKTWRRGHPMIPLPALFGHEFSGVVKAVGAGVAGFRSGDAVMAVHSAPCGDCFYCRAGQGNLCDTTMEAKVLGAFSEEILIPSHIVRCNVHPLPPTLDFAVAAFLEPLSCVVHGARQQPLRPEESLLIVGAGPISLLFLLLAQARGLSRIYVAGRRPERLRMARQLGACEVFDVNQCDLAEEMRRRTDGRGVDQIIECTGLPEVWEGAVGLARRGGRVLLFGGCPGGTSATFDTGHLHYDEITVQGVFHFTPDAVREARQLLVDGRIDVTPLISDRLPLTALPEVLQRLVEGDGFKYALLPEG